MTRKCEAGPVGCRGPVQRRSGLLRGEVIDACEAHRLFPRDQQSSAARTRFAAALALCGQRGRARRHDLPLLRRDRAVTATDRMLSAACHLQRRRRAGLLALTLLLVVTALLAGVALAFTFAIDIPTTVHTLFRQPGENRYLVTARDGSWIKCASDPEGTAPVTERHPGCSRGARAWRFDPAPVLPTMGMHLGFLHDFSSSQSSVMATPVCR